ncbi:MAG: 3'-5' exonuclease [Planctomycetota bacterium]
MSKKVAHLIFDVESVADGELIANVRYPTESLSPTDAVKRYQDELLETTKRTFIPYTFQVPVSVVIAKVGPDMRLIDVVSLDEPQFRPHVITENFWRGWEMYERPQWVTFNGRTFDLPIMELAAYRYGISLPGWFALGGYKAPRNRYNTDAHFDLQELLTNFGAARLNGGLNLAAQMVGKPGKVGLKGEEVQQQYDAGNHQGISDYCRCDVLDTYFVFLRCKVLTGNLTRDAEQQLVADAKAWIESRADEVQAYADYLEHWSEWNDPWQPEPEGENNQPDPDESPDPEDSEVSSTVAP